MLILARESIRNLLGSSISLQKEYKNKYIDKINNRKDLFDVVCICIFHLHILA